MVALARLTGSWVAGGLDAPPHWQCFRVFVAEPINAQRIQPAGDEPHPDERRQVPAVPWNLG